MFNGRMEIGNKNRGRCSHCRGLCRLVHSKTLYDDACPISI